MHKGIVLQRQGASEGSGATRGSGMTRGSRSIDDSASTSADNGAADWLPGISVPFNVAITETVALPAKPALVAAVYSTKYNPFWTLVNDAEPAV